MPRSLELADTIGVRYRALVLGAGLVGLRLRSCSGCAARRVDLPHGSVRVQAQEHELATGGRLWTAPESRRRLPEW